MAVEGFQARCQKVLQVAKELHARKPDWVTFFRETLGVSGAARSVFPQQEDYVLFEQSQEFTEIQQLVASLRTRKVSNGKNEATRVITVRLPESLHESLKAEAADHNTSMNKLCISKLLQALIEEEEAQKAAQQAKASAAVSRPNDRAVPMQAPASSAPAPINQVNQYSPLAPQPQPVQPIRPAQQGQPSQNPRSGFRSTFGQ